MSRTIPLIRIFLSSPGDVQDERKLALNEIENLVNRRVFREKVAFRVVAWDKPSSGTVLRARMTPQEAINLGLPKPSECDIVIVLFWSRLGSPFTLNGIKYESGTHYELLDALNVSGPEIVIYHRSEKITFDPDSKTYDSDVEQYRRLQNFFKSDLFYNSHDGQIRRNITMYEKPDDFRRRFADDLEELVVYILEQRGHTPLSWDRISVLAEPVTEITASTWQGSPFPGLRAFTEVDSPIFFGRGREVDALIRRVEASRFVAVMGASGSGKSSLVGAGLIPRLRGNTLIGSKDWYFVQFTPGNDPFESLYQGLCNAIPSIRPNPFEAKRIKQHFSEEMQTDPNSLLTIVEAAFTDAPTWTEVVLFIDQFEELFNRSKPEICIAFINLLEVAVKSNRLRVIVTVRADFYHRCIEFPALTSLLEVGTFPLGAPARSALKDMIEHPAERAGLEFESDLAVRILDDTGNDPGALALMAYTLDELYYACKDTGKLTLAAYEELGGVQGAIGKRSETIFVQLSPEAQATLPNVFKQLVEVDERGTSTRKREIWSKVTSDESAHEFVTRFVDARLLVSNQNPSNEPYVEVAHEALLRSWERLANWIDNTQDDLRLLRQVRLAAEEWDRNNQHTAYLWPHERLQQVYHMKNRLNIEFEDEATTYKFIQPEATRLIEELEDPKTHQKRQQKIIERLIEIGESGLDLLFPDLLDAYFSEVETAFGDVENVTRKVLVKYLGDALAHSKDHVIDIIEMLNNADELTVDHILIVIRNHQDENIRVDALKGLSEIRDLSAVDMLINVLYEEANDLRCAAIEALGNIGASDAVISLLPLLKDRDTEVVLQTIHALGNIGGPEALRALIQKTKDSDFFIRHTATEVLDKIKDSIETVDLLNALRDKDQFVRYTAVTLLGQVGGAEITELLLETLSDKSKEVRHTAITILGRLGDEIAVTPLINALQVNDPETRYYAAEALGLISDLRAIPSLIQSLKDTNRDVRSKAAEALGRIRSDEAVSALLESYHDRDEYVRAAAIWALGHINDNRTIRVLIDALNDPDKFIRRIALDALYETDDEAALEAIELSRQKTDR